MGVPYIPVVGLVGTDLLKRRDDMVLAPDPIDGKTISVVAKAMRPDVAVFHVDKADRQGNVSCGYPVEAVILAEASRHVIVTAEEIVDRLDEKDAIGTFLPSILVDVVVHAPFGSHPAGMTGRYGPDKVHMEKYVAASRDDAAFGEYLRTYVFDVDSHAEYVEHFVPRELQRPAKASLVEAHPTPVAGEMIASLEYNEAELLAVLMSREVRDGEVSACGALSQIPAAGLLLAKELHAPSAELIILNTVFRPFSTSRQFHYLAQRGELGLFFVSGVQIDGRGNYNLHQIGTDPERPEVRFPGGYGGGMIYYCARRSVVFRTEHTRRSLVERVDFISAAGSSPGNVLRLGNPSKLITPKANFRFDKDEGRLRLDSIHPSYTLDEIRENTGFDLGVTGPVVTTPAPTAEELRVLRNVVRSKMIETGTYAGWAERSLGSG